MRIGRIHYLNTDPFFLGWNGDAVVDAHPRRLGEWAARGVVDAGPLPLVDGWRLEREFEPVGRFGIAVRREARSVLLLSRKPWNQLAGAAIGVTDQTSTSVRLLRLLLREDPGGDFHLRPGYAPADDARLIIGDEALRLRHRGGGEFPHVIDLAEEWHRRRGLPFVFARWMVRRTVPGADKRGLAARLARALALFRDAPDTLPVQAAARLGLAARDTRSYLRGMIFELGPREEEAAALFRRLLVQEETAHAPL
jgi:chorismate dehydratase